MTIKDTFKVLWKELLTLNRLAAVSVVCNSLDAGFFLVDIIMLGHAGRGHLSAAVVALAFYNVAWFFVEGVLTAQDTLLARSSAVSDAATARYWTYIALLVVLVLSCTSTVFFAFAPLLMFRAFSIRYNTVLKACEFLFLLLPAYWLHGVYRVVQKYLISQRMDLFASASAAIGIAVNIVGNFNAQHQFTFVVTHFVLLLIVMDNGTDDDGGAGAGTGNVIFMFLFGWKFSGCAFATIVARAVMLAAALAAVHQQCGLFM